MFRYMGNIDNNIAILKKLGVWEKWRINYDNYNRFLEQDDYSKQMKDDLSYSFSTLIGGSFIFRDTPEGFLFWNEIRQYNENTTI